MRIIINNIECGDMILAGRAAERAMRLEKDKRLPIGSIGVVGYENGDAFAYSRNKASISIWKQ